jgi:pimeloyl-ACP methyl ester carboxylesterase
MNHPSDFTLTTRSGTDLRGDVDGAGPPLVLLHGLTATRRYVLQGSRLLARRGGRSLVAYDARGHGESGPGSSYGYAELVEDLGEVLDQRGLERAVLAGSSMGAHTAVGFALAFPERVDALVLITPAYAGAPGDDMARWDARADALEAGEVEEFVTLTGVDSLPDSVRETARLAVRQRIERQRDLNALAEAVRQVPRSAAFDGLDRLREIEVPVLVVGSRDEADPEHPLEVAREYAERLPRGDLLSEDEGEAPLAWRGAQLSRAIQRFLDGAAGYS